MSSNIYTVGLQNVGSFQVSGIPYATGSLCPHGIPAGMVVKFPYVTKWVTVQNVDPNHPLFVGFSSNGINAANANNYFVELPPATAEQPIISTGVMDLKLTEVWLSGSGIGTCQVLAGLTNLPVARLNTPNGINWTGSSGVG